MARRATPKTIADPLAARLRASDASLSPTALRVARFIDENRILALASSAAEIAAGIGTSDASVVRAVQALGFKGLADLRRALTHTLEHKTTPADNMRRTLGDIGQDIEQAVDLVLKTHTAALEALASKSARTKVVAAVSVLRRAQRIVVFGIGPSAPLARYFTILLARSGRRTYALDATGSSLADQLLNLREGDALLVLAYGRPYREVLATFAEADRLALPVVLVSDSLDRKLARQAAVIVPARRGQTQRVALHATTLAALEAVALGLAASAQENAMSTLGRLNKLRETLNGARADVE
jgi:DNA-binding MurR/RpiR family transcriptional regulator